MTRRVRTPARRCGTAASAARCSIPTTPPTASGSLALASHADVLVESFAPGVAAQLGIDYDTLLARNPRLVYCSITAYGDDGAHADRPAVDALVAARTGHQWESRGVAGGTLARLAGVAAAFPDLVVPDDCWVAAPASRPALLGRAVGEHGVGLPRHARDQRRAARARADRPRPARVDVAAPGRARHHARRRGSASSTPTPPTSRAGSSTRARRRACSAAPTAGGSTSGCRSPTS